MEDPNTSLDESDETDASMSDDSWVDYFDLDEGKKPERLFYVSLKCSSETELQVDGVTFKPAYYRNFCKQYALQRRDRMREFEAMYVLTRGVSQSGIYRNSYSLVREQSIPIGVDQGPRIAEDDSNPARRTFPLPVNEDLDYGQHSIRVESASDIVLFLTPLLVPAISCLQEATSRMVSTSSCGKVSELKYSV